MTAKTPQHGDLVAAVADLSPRKVEKFAIALGVPKNVVEESQINNPKDIDRVKLDALDWWIRNENASWEAVAKALEAKGVDERNLAKRIRSSHGLIVPVEDGKSIWAECMIGQFLNSSRGTVHGFSARPRDVATLKHYRLLYVAGPILIIVK